MSKPIHIKPHPTEQYDVTQSVHDHVGRLPTRSIVLGPSGSGKTILLQNLILDVYRNCFSRIYIVSPSIHVDTVWNPVKKYLFNELNQEMEQKKKQTLFEQFDEAKMYEIIETQHKLIDHMKRNKMKRLFQILILLDDVADDKQLCRNSRLLNSLYVRGRHDAISVITSVQYYHTLSPVIRVNATQLYVFKLRNQRDLESLIEALSALASKDEILELYKTATNEPHSFWYIDLIAKEPEKMFFKNLNQRLILKPSDPEIRQ